MKTSVCSLEQGCQKFLFLGRKRRLRQYDRGINIHRVINLLFMGLVPLFRQCYNSAMVWKLEGYLLIPHELLHVLAHKLVSRRCTYRLGDSSVQHTEQCTTGQYLFCLLFPFLVSLPIALLPLLIWVITYGWYDYSTQLHFSLAPLWHQALFATWFLLFTYVASSCFYDIVFAARLLFKKLPHQPPDKASNH